MRDGDTPSGPYILGIMLLLFAMWLGVRFPDVDQSLFWLKPIIIHRSILTHGLILPFFLFVQYQVSTKISGKDNPIARLGLMGLLIGLCAHLAFDLYPDGWRGFSQIYVPLYGHVSPQLSRAWLGSNVFLGLFLCCRLLRKTPDQFVAITTIIVAFILAAQSKTTAPALEAFLTLGVFGFIAFLLDAHLFLKKRRSSNAY